MATALTYPGGKNGAGVHQQIISQMPEHRVYIEPFLGSGAILRRKLPAALNIGVDLDREMLVRVREELQRQGTRCPDPIALHSDTGLLLANLAGGIDKRSRLAASGESAGKIAESSDAYRRESVNPPMADPASLRFARAAGIAESGEASDRDSRCWFLHGDALTVLREYPWSGRELVYCDPPYPMVARGCVGRAYYKHELTEDQHVELVHLLKLLPCQVMLSGYWSELYDVALSGWRVHQYRTTTRGGGVTERLWMNFGEPARLHDVRFVGSGFRERERIGRKQKRWVQRLGQMKPMERNALLEAIRVAWGGGAER